jgi:polysaccharide export outer membrane protein
MNHLQQKGRFVLTHNLGVYLLIISFLFLFGGCAGIKKTGGDASQNSLVNNAEIVSVDKEVAEVKIREYVLSPGDEIDIAVFPQKELSKRLTIPPDGHIFYPLVGELDVQGKTLKELRKIIVDGLSSYKKSQLVPGDEISIAVYRNDDLNRQFVIPPEGYIFYPLVGEINVQGKTLKQLRKTIATKLSKYIVKPQVQVDLVSTEQPKVVIDPQVGIAVVSFGGQKIFVLGEVNSPGVFLADGHTGVIEAISNAGGLTLDAEQKSILLIREGGDKPKPELITLNLEKILTDGDFKQNMILQRGDIIYVPRSFIANVDRFFQHLATILSPILSLESGIYIGQQMEGGKIGGGSTVPVR